jgi:hypothetical protein
MGAPPVSVALRRVKSQRCEGLLVVIEGVCVSEESNNDGIWEIKDNSGYANVLVNRNRKLFVDNVPGGPPSSAKGKAKAGKHYRVVGIVVLVREQLYIQTSSRTVIQPSGG